MGQNKQRERENKENHPKEKPPKSNNPDRLEISRKKLRPGVPPEEKGKKVRTLAAPKKEKM